MVQKMSAAEKIKVGRANGFPDNDITGIDDRPILQEIPTNTYRLYETLIDM